MFHSWLSDWMLQQGNNTTNRSLYQHSVITSWTAKLGRGPCKNKAGPIPSCSNAPTLSPNGELLLSSGLGAAVHRGGVIFTHFTVSCLTPVSRMAASTTTPPGPSGDEMRWV